MYDWSITREGAIIYRLTNHRQAQLYASMEYTGVTHKLDSTQHTRQRQQKRVT